MEDPNKKKKKSKAKPSFSKKEKDYKEQINELEEHVMRLESLLGKSIDNSIFEVITTGCGFAPTLPHTEFENEGNAIIIIKADGSYDVICSYYNGPCRHNCQILKTVIGGEQNLSLEDYNIEEEIFGDDDTDDEDDD